LNDAIGQRALAVVDVGNDGKVADVIHGLKKRRVEVVTRLPTKRMATACWAFILAKSAPLETAPILGLAPLRRSNIKSCQQVVHTPLTAF
jgi:hypothetical protein